MSSMTLEVDAAATLSAALSGRPLARLTKEQRDEFERNGFLIIPEALDEEEVAAYRAVMARLDKTIHKDVSGHATDGLRSPGDRLELRNCIAYDDALLALMVHPKTFPLVVELMGPHIALTTSHALIRPVSRPGTPKQAKQVGWHRDGPVPSTPTVHGGLPWLYTKIGYFLTDLRIPDAGALRVVPGSHRYAGPAPQAGGSGEAEDSFDPYGTIEITCKPGTAVIFDNRLLHSVGPNYSSQRRENFYFGYCPRYLRPIDYVCQTSTVLEKATPIQRQLLGEASSSCGYYLPQEDDVPLAAWQRGREKGGA